jgi:hypothetical protein
VFDVGHWCPNACVITLGSGTLVNLMNETERQRMTELCTAIAVEEDSEKMIALVHEFNILLETKQERLDRKQAKAS